MIKKMMKISADNLKSIIHGMGKASLGVLLIQTFYSFADKRIVTEKQLI